MMSFRNMFWHERMFFFQPASSERCFKADRDLPSPLWRGGGVGVAPCLADQRQRSDEAHADRHPFPLVTREKGRRAARFCAFILALSALASPAVAASITSLDFFADAQPANTFLVASSRLAAANGAGRIAAFARREIATRERVAADLTAWRAADVRTAEANDFAPSLDRLGRIFGPIDRSVAVTRTIDRSPVLARLATLSGRDFDVVYVRAQADALERLVALDKDFILNGDDETLRALAVHDLPRVRALLAEVRRLR